MVPNETNARPYVVTHLLEEILLRIVLLAAVCTMTLLVQPRIRYISQDELLRDFKRPRRHSCVPMWSLVCLIIFIPLIIFSLPWLLTNDVTDTTQAILGWTLALSVTAIITELLKLAVGRPRPDFFYRCFPDGNMTYATRLQCTGYTRDVMEGRKSFPSGHSSLSFASLGYLSQWMVGRCRAAWGRGRRARSALCALPLAAAGAVGASRVRDHRHHGGDVLAGAALGALAAYCCYARYYHPLTSDLAGLTYASTDPNSISSRLLCSQYLDGPDVDLSNNTLVVIN